MIGDFSGLTARTSGLNDKGNPIRDPVADGGGVQYRGVDAITIRMSDYYIDAQTYYHSLQLLESMIPYVHDLTYIKFREISIGYDIPMEKIGSIKKYIRGANISLIAQNLWLIYAKSYDFDPSEVSDVSGEEAQYPGIRSYGANIKDQFLATIK